MFYSASSFNQDISGWDVSNFNSFKNFFWNASSFNQDISGWNTENQYNFNNMFTNATSFNQDLSSWDVSSANYLQMFDGATALSDENKCAIQKSFSSNSNWPYDWTTTCVYGCMDEAAFNYNSDADTEDGSCVAIVSGYDAAALTIMQIQMMVHVAV